MKMKIPCYVKASEERHKKTEQIKIKRYKSQFSMLGKLRC
jgi:hypothetical protein